VDLQRKIEQCSRENIRFTKTICLEAPFHTNLRERCSHHDSIMPDIKAAFDVEYMEQMVDDISSDTSDGSKGPNEIGDESEVCS
jgi:hypothetical protein